MFGSFLTLVFICGISAALSFTLLSLIKLPVSELTGLFVFGYANQASAQSEPGSLQVREITLYSFIKSSALSFPPVFIVSRRASGSIHACSAGGGSDARQTLSKCLLSAPKLHYPYCLILF